MYGFKKGGKPQPEEQALSGGLIEGPGTGTSDSIKAKIPRGSYIMPADSTAEIGPEALAQMGPRGFKPGVFDPSTRAAPAPGQGFGFKPKHLRANVSNGEYQLPPEQVHAIGAQVLDQMKGATHTPVAPRGLKPKDAELFFANGGAVESTDDLIARISAKYGTGASPAAAPQPAAPVERPAQRPAPALSIGSAADAIRARRQQINEAAGYADGGLVIPPNTGFGFGPTSVGARMKAERQKFADGGLVDDDERPTSVAGAPGVQRVGNSYSDAAPAPAQPATTLPAPGGLPKRTPTFGETMNRINDQRAERTGAGLYGTPRTEAQKLADTGRPGYEDRVNAIPGPSNDAILGMKRLAANEQKPAQPVPPKPGIPPKAPPVQPGPGFGEWQAGASQQERDTAADIYRGAWQQQAPGGLRRAGQNATTLYNAEQQVRGTGVTAQRGANGQMEFSGNGANALPQTFTGGFNVREGNAAMARANAVRDSMLQGNGTGSPGGGVIADSGAADTNSTLARWGQDRMIQRAIDSGNPRMVDGAARLAAVGQDRYSTDAQIASRDRNAAEDRIQRGEIAAAGFSADRARAALEQQRLGLEERRANGELRAMGFQARGLERLENLQTQYEQAKTPEQRAQLAEQIRVLTGREAPNRYTVVPGGQELTEQGMRTVPSRVLNNQTGQFVEQPAAGPKAPAGMTAVGKTPAGQIVYQDAQGRRFTSG